MKNENNCKPGVGLDIGTMNLVSARFRKDKEGAIETNRMRDAFIGLDPEAKKALKLSKVNYTEHDGNLMVLGDSALTIANLFKQEVRRPLSRGVISAGELEAIEVLKMLTSYVLGPPVTEKEHCYFSVPASPIDDPDQDVVYHTEIFKRMLSDQTAPYTPHPLNEAMAIIYSQCAKENFSGLAISFGSGMMNVALAYQTVKGLDFSLARAGDWVDLHAAKAVGSTAARMCAVKEKGVDLTSPKSREEEAIVLYLRYLIRYCLENTVVQFRRAQSSIDLPNPIPLIVSGGTSKAGGFVELFTEEFKAIQKKGFPIPISEVRAATDPMTAVAEGLLVLASEEYVE
jgi:hypothetical protein